MGMKLSGKASAIYRCDIPEELVGVSKPSHRQHGGTGSKRPSHYVRIFHSHVCTEHPSVTAEMKEREKGEKATCKTVA